MSTLKADSVTASSGVNTDLALTGKGTGKVALGDAALTVPDTDGSANQYLRTTGSAALEFATLPAIPAEAFTGFRNLIINGDMAVAQRGTSFADPANLYTLDRWRFLDVGAAVVTVTQDTDTPTVAEAGTDFKFSLKVDVTTGTGALGVSDQYAVGHRIEGFNMAHLGIGAANAATITISFWVKSTITGTAHVALMNDVADRAYPASYTIDSSDTWEKKTVTIDLDTTGTWVGATNGIGLRVNFGLAAGTNLEGTANTWNAANNLSASGAANLLNSTANNFYITGVQFEVGSSATDFEHVPYDYQLRRCERYYQTYGMGFLAFGLSATVIDSRFAFRTMMRSSPSVTLLDTTPTFMQVGVATRTGTSSSITTSAQGPDGTGLVRVDGFSSVGTSSVCIGNQSTPIFGFSAEL